MKIVGNSVDIFGGSTYKVMCIEMYMDDVSPFNSSITYGKWYDALYKETYDGANWHLISDDSGEHRHYPRRCFLTIEEYREQQINMIL